MWGASPSPMRTTCLSPASSLIASITGAKMASTKQVLVSESRKTWTNSFGAKRRLRGLMIPPPRNPA